MHQMKTQIILHNCAVSLVFIISMKKPLFLAIKNVLSEESDQTAQLHRLILHVAHMFKDVFSDIAAQTHSKFLKPCHAE